MLTVAQLAPVKTKDPYLYETLVKVVNAVNAASQNAGVDPSTPAPAPAQIGSVQVQAANGWFDLVISDPGAACARPGLFYFAESDVTPGFNSPRVYFLGSSRNLYMQLGNQTLYWRAYSQYVGSSPSTPVTYGSPAIAVTGGGGTGPTPLPSGGSGTMANGTVQGGNGFGVPVGARVVKTPVL